MPENITYVKRCIVVGISCGLAVSLLYPAIFFVPNLITGVVLASALGPLLGISTLGMYHFLTLYKKQIATQIATVANIIGGTLLTTMLLVQLAIVASKPETVDLTGNWVWTTFHHIHYGLDLAWDVFFFLGILCYSLAMLTHPKIGKGFAIPGLIIAVLFISVNIWTFPVPPASADLIDIGPLVGLWYLAVTVRVIMLYRKIGRE